MVYDVPYTIVLTNNVRFIISVNCEENCTVYAVVVL